MSDYRTREAFVQTVSPLTVKVPGDEVSVPAELSGPYPASVTNDANGTLEEVSTITGLAADAMTANTIYANVVSLGGGSWRVDFYKQSKRTTKIGHTANFTADGSVAVSPDGGYGLGGTITIGEFATIAADTNISIAVTQYKPAAGDRVEIVDRSPEQPLLRGKVS